jgi:maltooligosyltrehalose trehalohydrolase
VREYFIQNALMWLCDYRCDGLRLDAVHAIDQAGLPRRTGAARARSGRAGRQSGWCWKTSTTRPRWQQGFDAQWNDDGHNALHVLLTGETEGYYADYQQRPIDQLARCLAEGFVFQGQANRHGTPRGEPSGTPAAQRSCCSCRTTTRSATAPWASACPPLPAAGLARGHRAVAAGADDPAAVHGRRRRQPRAVPVLHRLPRRAGRCRARRPAWRVRPLRRLRRPRQTRTDPRPQRRNHLRSSRPQQKDVLAGWHGLYQQLLDLRKRHLIPHLPGTRALGTEVLGDKALTARWRLGNGQQLRIDLNLDAQPQAAQLPAQALRLFDSSDTAHPDSTLAAHSCVVSLLPPAPETP